jgi:hypothetical protein
MIHGQIFRTHVADQLLAALATSELPLTTPELQKLTGYDGRFGPLAYQVLTRLARSGDVERMTPMGIKPVCWRRTAPVLAIPAELL